MGLSLDSECMIILTTLLNLHSDVASQADACAVPRVHDKASHEMTHPNDSVGTRIFDQSPPVVACCYLFVKLLMNAHQVDAIKRVVYRC